MALEFYNPGQEGITAKLRRAVENATAFLGRTIGITSGYRSPSYNAGVGGATGSYHTSGQAVDIDMSGMSTAQRKTLVQNLIDEGVGGLITYSSSPNMLHADMRPQTGGKAWFMHDRTNANIHKAPTWFQSLVGYVSGSRGSSVATDEFGFGQDYEPPATINDAPRRSTNLLDSILGPSPFNYENYQTGGAYSDAPDPDRPAGGVLFGEGSVTEGMDPVSGLTGWFQSVALTVLFVILGLVFLAAGLFLVTKGETTFKLEMPE